MELKRLEEYVGQLLAVSSFRDYCPNGLQVEGRSEVCTLVTGVTACLPLLERAHELGADAVLVHHGYFWKNESPCVVGYQRRRLALLLRNDISLLAYHLPLDAHRELGNNAQLAALLGVGIEGWFGEQQLAGLGALPGEESVADFVVRAAALLGREPLLIGCADRPLRRLAWCSGGGQGYLPEAVALGVDAFLTGEISEPAVHQARETGVTLIAAGHHATERYGVRALGEHLAQRFGLVHHFVDVPSPV